MFGRRTGRRMVETTVYDTKVFPLPYLTRGSAEDTFANFERENQKENQNRSPAWRVPLRARDRRRGIRDGGRLRGGCGARG